jgi:hypothetical protein
MNKCSEKQLLKKIVAGRTSGISYWLMHTHTLTHLLLQKQQQQKKKRLKSVGVLCKQLHF